jgi:hypothetical protein
VRELYGYLKPGGVWIMYEHIKTKEMGWVEWYQGVWKHFHFECYFFAAVRLRSGVVCGADMTDFIQLLLICSGHTASVGAR